MFRQTLTGAWSLLVGMKVTLKHAFRPPVTSQYPRERIEMSKAYRNVIRLIEIEEIGSHDCIDCQACVRVCPSDCIKVEGERPEGMRKKRATLFEVEFALCSECGLCIDVCPTDTLGYSREYDQAGFRRSDFLYDLLDEWRAQEPEVIERLRADEEQKAAAKKAAAARAAAAKKAKEEQEVAGEAPTDGAPADAPDDDEGGE
jgi:NADH-quinone oxidoreductase chain I